MHTIIRRHSVIFACFYNKLAAMKHLPFFSFCVFVLAAMAGCSTKFNTAAPYQNITIVYGLLDEGDTAHYIRIQKAFLSQSLSAYNMEKVADSSFYPQLNVVLEAFNSGSMVGAPITLTRVDLNQEGYQKDSGAFFTTPNYAYKFKNALDPNNTYRLLITNPASGEVDSAETTIIDESSANFSCPYLDNLGTTLSFSHSANPFLVRGSVPPTVAYMEGILRVRWVEKNSQTNTTVKKYADWDFATATPSGNAGATSLGFSLTSNNFQFYDFLSGAMQVPPQFVTRLMDSAQLILSAANTDFYNYMQITQTLGTGLTGMDIEPNYTNMLSSKGINRVLGLYGGRAFRSGYVVYDVATLDSIMANPVTKNLGIVGSAY